MQVPISVLPRHALVMVGEEGIVEGPLVPRRGRSAWHGQIAWPSCDCAGWWPRLVLGCDGAAACAPQQQRSDCEDHLSSEPCCFFYVCGYVFDSLPVDLHVFFPTDGPADSAELLVDAQAPNRALRAGPRRSAVGLMERYAHDEDLRDLARGLLDASGGLALRAMPVAATSAFRRLQALACGDEDATWRGAEQGGRTGGGGGGRHG